MYKLQNCTLAYVKNVKNSNTEEIIEPDVKIRVGEPFSSRYYKNQQIGRELSAIAIISDYWYAKHLPNKLQFVYIGEQKFKILKLEKKPKKQILLELQELK